MLPAQVAGNAQPHLVSGLSPVDGRGSGAPVPVRITLDAGDDDIRPQPTGSSQTCVGSMSGPSPSTRTPLRRDTRCVSNQRSSATCGWGRRVTRSPSQPQHPSSVSPWQVWSSSCAQKYVDSLTSGRPCWPVSPPRRLIVGMPGSMTRRGCLGVTQPCEEHRPRSAPTRTSSSCCATSGSAECRRPAVPRTGSAARQSRQG